MADITDRASQLEEQQRNRALAQQQARGHTNVPGALYCRECAVRIPPARRAFGGITRCIDCQAWSEQRARR